MTGLSGTLGAAGAGLSAISALGFVVYLFMLGQTSSVIRTIAKTVAVGALAALALHAGGPLLLVLALILSALGDALLTHEGDVAFLGGLGSFLAAHIAYAVLFVSIGPGFADAPLPGLLVVTLFGLGMGTLMARKAGTLALPVVAYVLAITVMGLGGVTLGGLVLLGAALFMASDAILGSEKFLMPEGNPLRRLTSPAVWVLYYAGQVLITLGLLA